MKCLNPPFSAWVGDQSMVFEARVTGVPSSVVISAPARVRVATSPSLRKTTSRVWASRAGMSLAQSVSPWPRPMTSGLSALATTISSGEPVDRTAMP